MNNNSRRIVSRRTFWCLCLAAGLLFLGAVFLLSRHADMQDCERRMTELIDFVKEQSSSYVQYNETAVAKALVRGTTAVQELEGVTLDCGEDELRQYAPLYIVRGNNDKDWAEAIPHDLTVTLGGVTFFMVHNRKEVPADLAGVDAVVFGHSHKYVQEEKDGVLWLNPGSCGPRRFHQEITMMTAEAEDGKIRVEKVIIPHGTA